MSFTSAATTQLTRFNPRQEYVIEARTAFGGSNTWEELNFIDFSNEETTGRAPATLSVQIPNTLDLGDESDQTNRMQLFGEVRLTAYVGSESKVLLQGRIKDLVAKDYGFRLDAEDWSALYPDCVCVINREPDAVEVVASNAYRRLYFCDGAGGTILGRNFGLQVDGSGTDPGFDEASQSRRRSWQPGNIRIYRTNSSPTAEDEVQPDHYSINYEDGAVTILEAEYEEDGTTPRTYYINDLRCYLESAASGAANCDLANLYKDALEYPAAAGGMGLTSSDYSIPDTGIDLGGAFNFDGKASDLFDQIAKAQQANLFFYYDSSTQKHTLTVVTQKAAGAEDYTLVHPQSISQPRTSRDFYTRIEARGKSEMPSNILSFHGNKISPTDTAAVDVTDLRAALSLAGTWLKWNKADGGADSTFANVVGYLYDGNHGIGAGVMNNLPATENAGGSSGATDKYDSWYNFIQVDMGETRIVQRIRAKLPSSQNPNQNIRGAGAHNDYFWPGIWVQISEDGTNYFDISPQLYKKRDTPMALLDIPRDQITHPRGRYIRVYLGAFKQGTDNASTPAIGLLEFEVFCDEDYKVIKEIYASEYDVIALDQVGKTFTIDGDHTAEFTDDTPFGIQGSTGNDKFYRCNGNSTLSGGDTVITVDQSIPDSTVDGAISLVYLYTEHTDADPSYYYRGNADLSTRLGRRNKTDILKLDGIYNEFMAHDAALLQLEESLRLYQTYEFVAVCDPRPSRFQTVAFTDTLNGNGSFLVEKVRRNRKGCSFEGTDYLAGVLGR